MKEAKVGETIIHDGIMAVCCADNAADNCTECAFFDRDCDNIECRRICREDKTDVYFQEIEQ